MTKNLWLFLMERGRIGKRWFYWYGTCLQPVLPCSLSNPAACPSLQHVLPFHLSYPTSLFVCLHLLIFSQYSSTTSSSWPFTKSSPPLQHFLLVLYVLIILPGKSSITQAVHCFTVVVKSISPFRYSLRNECSPSRTQDRMLSGRSWTPPFLFSPHQPLMTLMTTCCCHPPLSSNFMKLDYRTIFSPYPRTSGKRCNKVRFFKKSENKIMFDHLE